MTSLTWLSRDRSRGRNWGRSWNQSRRFQSHMTIPSSKAAILKFFLNCVQFLGHVFDLSPQVGQLASVVEDLWEQARVVEKLTNLLFVWSGLKWIDKRFLNHKQYHPVKV